MQSTLDLRSFLRALRDACGVFGLLAIMAAIANLSFTDQAEAGKRKRSRRAQAAYAEQAAPDEQPALAEQDPMSSVESFLAVPQPVEAQAAPKAKQYAWRCNGRRCQLVEVTE